MLELIAAPAPHVVAMRVAGRVTATELQQAIDAIEATKQQHTRVSFYAEVDAMRWMTGSALLRDLGYGLTQLGQIDHFHRAAVVTERRWIRTITTLENRFLKPLEIRVFSNTEKQPALEWACELPHSTHSPEAPM